MSNRSLFVATSFILFLAIPIFVFMGYDPVWGNKFSILAPSRYVLTIPLICFIVVLFSYLSIINRKGVPYVQ